MKNEERLQIVVVGGGSWGTALAHVLRRKGHAVTLLVRDAALACHLRQGENPRYLPGMALAPGLAATTDPACLAGAGITLLALPCQAVRAWLREQGALLDPSTLVVNAAKGLEQGSGTRVEQIVAQELPRLATRYAILSGPSFAAEVVRGQPTAVVLGCRDEALGVRLRTAFSSPAFRCYSSDDVAGVELGGALKNVIAIAAGLSDGLGFGDNTRAALITRGLAEMSRVGVALGARAHTFMGLSGLGDLTLTCTGDMSRNRQVGLRLGRGESLAHITASLGMVAEGVKTTNAAHICAAQHKLSAPICAAMHGIMHQGREPRDVVNELMTRALKAEWQADE